MSSKTSQRALNIILIKARLNEKCKINKPAQSNKYTKATNLNRKIILHPSTCGVSNRNSLHETNRC